MKLSKYPLTSSENMMTFEFISEGLKGLIHKLVRYQPTNLKDVYNLVLGDKDHTTGKIDDTVYFVQNTSMVISNNKDSEKVLASVVSTVYAFTDKFPNAWIYAIGSTKSRTRLYYVLRTKYKYRMGISRFLSEVEEDFEVLGERNDNWETFRENIEYESFLVRRKKKI